MQGFAPLLAKASEVSGASKYVPKALLPYRRTCHVRNAEQCVVLIGHALILTNC